MRLPTAEGDAQNCPIIHSSSMTKKLCPSDVCVKTPVRFMPAHAIPESLRKFEIFKRVTIVGGNGGLTKINVTTGRSSAEIYLHGAHITGFQKNGEPPLLFMSRLNRFDPAKPIRGGVPICFPWFGQRKDDVAHGFARITEWNLTKTSATPDGATLNFRLPTPPDRAAWRKLRTEFIVTVSSKLTMELVVTNDSADKAIEIENCLHTYFHVGDIARVSIAGLRGAPFDDFAAGAGGVRKVENDSVLRITKEINRVYPDTTGTVEIRDEKFCRKIRIEKSGSADTVVWNPWTTQLMSDFDPVEHSRMVCVESGNVKQNKIPLTPGKASTLRVELSSAPLQ
jgi:D-hexose-6-phosphate mutarotase